MSDRPDIVDELREIASSAYKADDDNSPSQCPAGVRSANSAARAFWYAA